MAILLLFVKVRFAIMCGMDDIVVMCSYCAVESPLDDFDCIGSMHDDVGFCPKCGRQTGLVATSDRPPETIQKFREWAKKYRNGK